MVTHSSTLAWKITWKEEPGRLQSMGLWRVGHDWATFTFHFHELEKEMATHSSILAWRIPGRAEPGGLLSVGSHRVRHGWSDLAAAGAAYSKITCSDSNGNWLVSDGKLFFPFKESCLIHHEIIETSNIIKCEMTHVRLWHGNKYAGKKILRQMGFDLK